MRVGEIAKRIEERLPLAWSEDWDNAGLTIGDPDAETERVAVSLDATERSVCMALGLGCKMLVTHHPAIFRPVNRIVRPSPVVGMISAALSGGLSVYSAHTNWDSSPGGVNVTLSNLLGLSGVSPIEPPKRGEWGMGAIGRMAAPVTLTRLARQVKDAWGLSAVTAYGDDESTLSLAALCGGAGSELMQAALDLGADVYITADVSYHYILHAQGSRTCLIVVNHGEMERVSLPGLCEVVREASGLDAVLLEDDIWVPMII
ncbi:MAG: Nif3-like dinuclear metal center hexameric protein [Synergistaceae bacterium]|jgi:dinuclear metal center YbgI/SA1388 family protein|nr:Nif3-like dinuclear metal center hexameric protein [Synergistaceae bacterium]